MSMPNVRATVSAAAPPPLRRRPGTGSRIVQVSRGSKATHPSEMSDKRSTMNTVAITTNQGSPVERHVTNEHKSTGAAYLMWFFLGFFAAHRFYLGRPGS